MKTICQMSNNQTTAYDTDDYWLVYSQTFLHCLFVTGANSCFTTKVKWRGTNLYISMRPYDNKRGLKSHKMLYWQLTALQFLAYLTSNLDSTVLVMIKS